MLASQKSTQPDRLPQSQRHHAFNDFAQCNRRNIEFDLTRRTCFECRSGMRQCALDGGNTRWGVSQRPHFDDTGFKL